MKRTVDYIDGKVVLIDQTRIPAEMMAVELTSVEDVAEAIVSMRVRGAPAIGVTAALGVVLAAQLSGANDVGLLIADIEEAAALLKQTRPTAVNLFWGIDRIVAAARSAAASGRSVNEIRADLDELALRMLQEDEDTCRLIGANGAVLLADNANVLTHCNAGALACVSYGTALGVIRAAVEQGKRIHVYADETRPRLQGMKLTCFELAQDGIPVTVIADNMAGSLMRKGLIDCVVVGADRIAANGDVANKIGTYSVAVLARHHGIPFYVAAPMSTVDLSLTSGEDIPIEERSHEEVTAIDGHNICPAGVDCINPSFDVTPAELVTAIITEKGIARAPYNESLVGT
jgi:methylthioribose-1-phosphate isomerase